MSARLLKKVLQEQEAARHQNQFDGDGESESPDSSSAPSLNPFDLLNDDDDDVDQGNESKIADKSMVEDMEDDRPSAVKVALSVPSSNHKSKKKKKKKIKEDSHSSSKNSAQSWDSILENLSIRADSDQHVVSRPTVSKNSSVHYGERVAKTSILQVDPKFLKAENELRRIFGSRVVDSFEKSQRSGSSSRLTGASRRGSHSHRKSSLVSPSEHWPRWDGSLSMELLETKDGVHYFRYVHSPSYSQAQRAFEAAKAIHDLNAIGSILLHHPYHIESLYTLAEYFEFSGEQQMSATAIGKCLYALECAWHVMFTPMQGNCQLKYGHETNKPFFSVLFTHLKNMGRRGCHRSALELCKLLLSVDSDDPKGAIFCIDYYSLRSEEYAWLERFSEEYQCDNSLWLYPNFSYSLAICRFYLEKDEQPKNRELENTKASSTDLMKQALMLHPSVLKKLVEKVPLKDQIWTRILKCRYFASEHTGSPSLDHLSRIYVERNYIIWRLPDLQKLLRDSALAVVETLENGGTDAKDWTCVRKEAFSSEKNEYSHLMISDFSDSVATMPADNLHNFLAAPGRLVQNLEPDANELIANRAPRDLLNRNPLAVLLESILPWVDYGTEEHDGRRAEQNED